MGGRREGDGVGFARGRGWKLECREEGDDEGSGVSFHSLFLPDMSGS